MKRRIVLVCIVTVLCVLLSACIQENWIQPETDSFGAFKNERVFRYSTDSEELVFSLQKKTLNGWKTVEEKTFRTDRGGYLCVKNLLSDGIEVAGIPVERKDKSVQTPDSIRFGRIKKECPTTVSKSKCTVIGEDAIVVYFTKEHDVKMSGKNADSAENGDYALMVHLKGNSYEKTENNK